MEDIFCRAKKLGIKFEQEIEEDLERLSGLQELLQVTEVERLFLMQAAEESLLQEIVAERSRWEIAALSKKIRCPRLSTSVSV